jgi:hypothetical protein
MIISMPTLTRSQQRYDNRLRNLVQRTGDVTIATHLGVPRSTARGWLIERPTVVVCLDVTELAEPELRQEVLKLRRRVPEAHGTAATGYSGACPWSVDLLTDCPTEPPQACTSGGAARKNGNYPWHE